MDLSPKLIDRSFSISFPKASKKELQRELQVNEEATKSSSDCLHYTTLVDEVKKKLDEKKEDYEKAWGDLLNELYKLDFDNIGLPLSHRLRRDFMVLSALVSACGFDENCTKDVFHFTRIMPRIRFHKSRHADKSLRDYLEKQKQLEKSRAWALIKGSLESQLKDQYASVISYWFCTHGREAYIEQEKTPGSESLQTNQTQAAQQVKEFVTFDENILF